MANDLNDIVNIVIEGNNVAQAEASFTNILILGEDGKNGTYTVVYGLSPEFSFTDQYILASSPSTVAGITRQGVGSPEYKAFSSIYSQKNSVGKAVVANMGYGTWTAVYSTVTFSSGTITAYVNGTAVSTEFDTDTQTTMTALVQQMKDDLPELVDATSSWTNGTKTLVVNAVSGKAIYSVVVPTISSTLVLTSNTPTTKRIHETLNALVSNGADFAQVGLTSRVRADIDDLASWCLANKVCSIIAVNDMNIVNQTLVADTTSFAKLQGDATNRYVAVINHSKVGTNNDTYVDFGAMGYAASNQVGTWTLCHKQIVGSLPDIWTANQRQNAYDKKCSLYEKRGSFGIIFEGWVATGEYYDAVLFESYLKSRLQTDIYTMLIKYKKVELSTRGLAILRGVVESRLGYEQANGAITRDEKNEDGELIGGYEITVLPVSSLSNADKLNRYCNDLVKFVYYYGNAIHKVKVTGVALI